MPTIFMWTGVCYIDFYLFYSEFSPSWLLAIALGLSPKSKKKAQLPSHCTYIVDNEFQMSFI